MIINLKFYKMKKTLLIFAIGAFSICNSQTWNLNGNTATDPNINFLGTIDAKDLILKTNNLERLRINSNGEIGIGTTPKSNIALNVLGSTEFTSNSTGDAFHFFSAGQNVVQGGDVMWVTYKYFQPNDVGLLTLSAPSSPTDWSQPKFTVRANGKVLIGVNWTNFALTSCADCNNYKLFVKDGIKTEKVKVEIAANNGWADYVFNKDYKLMPLNTLENYITKNGHLPEVPSTEEAIKDGIELKEMNILLLKKVEELTLYILEQNKRIEKLEQNNNK